MIEEDDFLQAPRMKELREKAQKAQETEEKKRILAQIVSEIVRKLNDVTISKISDDVAISNFDEVRAALANEIRPIKKSLGKLFGDINISVKEQSALLSDIKKRAEESLKPEFQPVLLKKVKDRVHVENLSDVIIPDDVKVNNLQDLEKYFESLSSVIKDTFNIEVPTPQVTVEPTPVNIPEIRIPETDLSGIDDLASQLKVIRQSLTKLKNNRATNPLAVRLSDGDEFIERLSDIVDQQQQVLGTFPGPIRLTADSQVGILPQKTITSGSTTVATAGTAVQVSTSSVPCDYVIVNADLGNTNPVVVGDSSVDATAGSMQGIILIPGNSPIRLDINDLSNLYVDAQTSGDELSYAYFK